MSQKKTIYLVVGCPGAGKSWVCEQIKHLFEYAHHDLHIGMTGDAYLEAIQKAADASDKHVLAETPFSISKLKVPLEAAGHNVVPLVISEHPNVISSRYAAREKKDIPAGHLTRQQTYRQRAEANGWFHGSSEQVLNHLKQVSEPAAPAPAPATASPSP